MPQDTTVQSLVLWAVALTTLFNFVSLVWTVFSGPSTSRSSRKQNRCWWCGPRVPPSRIQPISRGGACGPV